MVFSSDTEEITKSSVKVEFISAGILTRYLQSAKEVPFFFFAALLHPNSQVSLDIFPIWIPLISNEISNSQGRSVWPDRFFICYYMILVQGFSFYSIDGASVS
jgi:hypothetical protein